MHTDDRVGARKGPLENAIEFVETVQTLATFGEVNSLFRSFLSEWGFERWTCIQISSVANGIRHPLTRRFGNSNVAWLQRYREAAYIHIDTAAEEIIRRTSAFWWSEYQQSRELSELERRMYGEASELGAREGLAVPIRFPDGSVWSCLMTGERVEPRQDVRDACQIAAQFYASCALRLRDQPRPEVALAARLTPRQRELVTLLRFGNTQSDISKMLRLSESTVYNELADAKRRLNCHTVAELVAEALLNGEIDIGPEQ